MGKLPSAELLRELLSYDPGTGFLYWRARPRSMCKSNLAHSAWNARYAGALALHGTNGDGYRAGCILDKTCLAHRVIWKMLHDVDPVEIDHIDGDRVNNRIENLRNVSHQENTKNKKRRCDNTSGIVGVHQTTDRKRWHARIGVDGAKIYIGTFDTKEEAAAARKAAATAFGFSETHGVRT